MLFGIDLAGVKAIMDPVISEEASYEENELENAEVFPACATKRPLAEEETVLQDGTMETSVVDSKHNVLG